MNEIERAIFNINYFERDMDKTSNIGKDLFSALETALTVLRAELARQDAKPLTCDGCGYVGYSICEDCIRNKKVKKDYYKEKMCDRYFEEDGGQCWSCCCWNEDKKDYKIFVTCKGDKTKCCR